MSLYPRFLMVLTLLASACVPEYAQDEMCLPEECSGQCDDGRCLPADAVSATSCEGDDCGPGWWIAEGGCRDVSCPEGHACAGDRCAPIEDPCMTQFVACPDGMHCVEGLCEPDECGGHSCGAGRECLDGQCTSKPDCDGENCWPCLSDGMCEPDQVCRHRAAVPGPRYCRQQADHDRAGRRCQDPADCGDGACVGGRCAPACEQSQACGDAHICEFVPAARMRVCVSREASTCPGGCGEGYCDDGQCFTGCRVSGDCPGDCVVAGAGNAFEANRCQSGSSHCPDDTLRIHAEGGLFCVREQHCSLDAHCEDGLRCLDATALNAESSAYLGMCGLSL